MSSKYKHPHARGDSETVKFDDSTAYGGSDLSYYDSSSRDDAGKSHGGYRGSGGRGGGDARGYSRGGSGGGRRSDFGADRFGGDRESRGDGRFGRRDDDRGYGRRGDRGDDRGYGGSYGRDSRGGGGRRRGGGGSGRFSSFSDRARYDVEDEDEIFGEAAVEQGIKFEEYEELEVEVGGDRIPRAIEDFEHAEFPKQLAKNVERVGYKLPTPIQKHCVPFACDMRDVMACAQTGSGKTAAFLLPIVHCMMLRGIQEERVEGRRGRTPAPAAVILSPTRELAIQIHGHARKFCYQTGLRPVVIYGGADRRKQIRDLDSGVDLLVATPGRLNDFLESGTLTLEKCMFCVLDEADRMLDMGFMPQIEGIINDMPAKDLRQTLMFSATFPAEIQQLAAEFLKDDYLFISVGRVGAATTLVKQELRYAEQREKLRELLEMLPSLKGLKLVFVETRREADTVEHQLVRNSIDAISIHGDRSQYEREHALAMFKSGKTQVLVATDVAARGLDIPDVMYVINYDLPNNIDSYVHRIGRTGRCGNEGTAISFVNESNYPIFKDLLEILTEAKQKVPSWFDTMVERGGGRGRGGRRGGKGGTRYGGRDHRVSTGKGKSERYTHGGRSSGRGGDRGGGGFGDFYERDAW